LSGIQRRLLRLRPRSTAVTFRHSHHFAPFGADYETSKVRAKRPVPLSARSRVNSRLWSRSLRRRNRREQSYQTSASSNFDASLQFPVTACSKQSHAGNLAMLDTRWATEVVLSRRAVYVLHAFEKKSRQTRDRDFTLARERLKEAGGIDADR